MHVFLEGPDKVALVQGTLLAVAEKHKLGSTHIHEHLMHDREHMVQMSCLVCVVFVKFYLTETLLRPYIWIPLFQGKSQLKVIFVLFEVPLFTQLYQ
jgi:hypothetical protein